MKTFKGLVKTRQSVRKYNNSKQVESSKLELCLEAARLAPSASNSQPWTFIVVNKPDLKNKIANATFSKTVSFNKFTVDAPILIVVVTEKSALKAQMGNFLKNQQYNLLDIGTAIENFCLQATDLGLGTCMLGWFNEKKIKELLDIPTKKRVNIVISLGYAHENVTLRDKKRKSMQEFVKYNSYK